MHRKRNKTTINNKGHDLLSELRIRDSEPGSVYLSTTLALIPSTKPEVCFMEGLISIYFYTEMDEHQNELRSHEPLTYHTIYTRRKGGMPQQCVAAVDCLNAQTYTALYCMSL